MRKMGKVFRTIGALLFGLLVLGVFPQTSLAWSPINFDQGDFSASKLKDTGGKIIKIILMVSIMALIAIVIILGVSMALHNDDLNAQSKAKMRLVMVVAGIVVVALSVMLVTGLYKVLNPNNPWDSMRAITVAMLNGA